MAAIWKETLRPARRGDPPPWPRNKMRGYGMSRPLPNALAPPEVWYVRVCSFTFTFHTSAQLEACIEYYSRKIQPSSLIPAKAPWCSKPLGGLALV